MYYCTVPWVRSPTPTSQGSGQRSGRAVFPSGGSRRESTGLPFPASTGHLHLWNLVILIFQVSSSRPGPPHITISLDLFSVSFSLGRSHIVKLIGQLSPPKIISSSQGQRFSKPNSNIHRFQCLRDWNADAFGGCYSAMLCM